MQRTEALGEIALVEDRFTVALLFTGHAYVDSGAYGGRAHGLLLADRLAMAGSSTVTVRARLRRRSFYAASFFPDRVARASTSLRFASFDRLSSGSFTVGSVPFATSCAIFFLETLRDFRASPTVMYSPGIVCSFVTQGFLSGSLSL